MILKIVYIIFVSLYSILLLVSSVKAIGENTKKKEKKIDTGNLFILGGSVLQFFSILPLLSEQFTNYIFVLLTGLVFIHIGALVNGYKKYDKPHWQHHIVRLILSIIILYVFYISMRI